ncbi:Crp/Fnr family transcriptional regulator [Candidatus Daviesbacteria bacterium]|nr:Crp/Fnr family transcriptional regulator [Candidatus Daviesbacteria bacterium]
MDTKVKQKLDDFFKQYKYQKFEKGKILVRADANPKGIFYLTEGVVRRYSISQLGKELTLNIYRPISFFPMDFAINKTSSSHFYEAMSDVEVFRAPKKQLLEFFKENNDVMFDLISRIYKGLEGYMMRMEYLMAGNAQARLITEFLIYARRFGQLKGSKIIVNLKVTEKDLASQSGMTRETVSREIQKLKQLGIIDFKKNKLKFNKLEKLEQMLFGI